MKFSQHVLGLFFLLCAVSAITHAWAANHAQEKSPPALRAKLTSLGINEEFTEEFRFQHEDEYDEEYDKEPTEDEWDDEAFADDEQHERDGLAEYVAIFEDETLTSAFVVDQIDEYLSTTEAIELLEKAQMETEVDYLRRIMRAKLVSLFAKTGQTEKVKQHLHHLIIGR